MQHMYMHVILSGIEFQFDFCMYYDLINVLKHIALEFRFVYIQIQFGDNQCIRYLIE